jgi:hypothetical protein
MRCRLLQGERRLFRKGPLWTHGTLFGSPAIPGFEFLALKVAAAAELTEAVALAGRCYTSSARLLVPGAALRWLIAPVRLFTFSSALCRVHRLGPSCTPKAFPCPAGRLFVSVTVTFHLGLCERIVLFLFQLTPESYCKFTAHVCVVDPQRPRGDHRVL